MRRKMTPEQEVEAALLRRACGYRYSETTEEEKVDRDGRPYKVVKTVEKDQPPHTASAVFWLINRCPERWRYRPDGLEEAAEPGSIILTPVSEMEGDGAEGDPRHAAGEDGPCE